MIAHGRVEDENRDRPETLHTCPINYTVENEKPASIYQAKLVIKFISERMAQYYLLSEASQVQLPKYQGCEVHRWRFPNICT